MIEILVYPADEVEKEIDGLMDNFKEMELQKDEEIKQLREERQCLKDENSEAVKQFTENRIKIERLKKEKEWLIANWTKDKHYINNLWASDQLSMDEHKEKILKKMQRALEEK